MKTKIFFVMLVVILLSSVVFADPPTTEKHKTTTGQTPSMAAQYQTHRNEMIASKERISKILSEETTGENWRAQLDATVEEYQKYKAHKGALTELRGSIFKRGLYSFYDFVEAYDDWSGLNKFGVLFYGEEGLAKRRDMAAEYFCERALGILGGKQCWISRICANEYGARDMPPGRSVLVAQTGIGGFLPAVTVQGEKSLPIHYKEAGKSNVKYVYKITYSIANPHVRRELTYHVKLVGDANTYTSDALTVKAATEEEIFRESKLGNNPYMIEGKYDYHTVCLAFTPRMVTHMWGRSSELCSPISQYDGAATKPYPNTPVSTDE